MNRIVWFLALILALPAFAQRGGPTRPLVNLAVACESSVAAGAACTGHERSWCVIYDDGIIYACDPSTHQWTAVGSGGGGGGASDFATLQGGTSVGKTFTIGQDSQISFSGNGIVAASTLACADCVTMGTETSGFYAAGTAEGGSATGLECAACVDFASEVNASFSSLTLATKLTNETGSSGGGLAVFSKSPTIETPALTGFTASRCARFNSSGQLVPSSSGDCDSGDTGGGGGDPILISGTAVGDGLGVNFLDGAGVDISFNSGTSPDEATFVSDNTEVNDTTWGDNSDSSVVWTFNVNGSDATQTMTSSSFTWNLPGDFADQITAPGNYDGIRDNDVNLTPDPTCADSGSVGELHILDSNEGLGNWDAAFTYDRWDVCADTTLLFRFPAPSAVATHALFATATSGAPAYRALAVGDLPTSGTWSTTGAIDAGGGSVEVGNGAAPTLDATGEVGVDSTADQLCWFGGSAVKCADPRETLSVVLFAPTASDDPIILKAPYGMTVTNIDCIVGAATSTVIDVQECSATGTGCTTVDTTITCDTDGAADDGSLSNAAIDSGDWIKIDVGTVTGTPGFVSITVKYNIVRE